MHMEPEEKYLSDIITPLLSNPSALHISRSVDEMGVKLTLDVDQRDMGRIIGKLGETARSIRNILHSFGRIVNKRVSLVINEPFGSERRRSNFRNDKEMLEV